MDSYSGIAFDPKYLYLKQVTALPYLQDGSYLLVRWHLIPYQTVP